VQLRRGDRIMKGVTILDCINNHFSHWFTGQGYMADVSEGVCFDSQSKIVPGCRNLALGL